MVFTRPSSISGNSVTLATSRRGATPASFKMRWVPPVEIISIPSAVSDCANSTIPVLSVTLKRARSIRGIYFALVPAGVRDFRQELPRAFFKYFVAAFLDGLRVDQFRSNGHRRRACPQKLRRILQAHPSGGHHFDMWQ